MKGPNRKNKKNKFKSTMMLFISFIFLFSTSFLVGSYFGKKNSVVVSAVKTNENAKNNEQKNDNTKDNQKSNSDGEQKDKDKKEKKLEPVLDPYKLDGKKVAYLTFDDGPSSNLTPRILDILKKHDIKATFFLIGTMANENSELVKREKNEGHSVCIHSYSHDYKYVYSSTENFLSDVKRCEVVIKSILGDDYEAKLIRFPGGSFGNRLNPYKEAVKKAGYRYVDWNALNGDAEATYVSVDKLISRLKETAAGQEHLVILMHDAPAKETTVQALPSIIEYLKGKGYEFKLLY